MRVPTAELTAAERRALFEDLNYLNMSEIKALCRRWGIPYAISVETKEGARKKTGEDDRKGVILARVRHFLETGVVLGGTCFPARIVSTTPFGKRPTAKDRLYYGRYDKKSAGMVATLQRLTDGQFRNGAVARMLARELWSRGQAPTLGEFAKAWLRANEAHDKPNPEWAFLTDLAAKRDVSGWKPERDKKARRVMKVLEGLRAT